VDFAEVVEYSFWKITLSRCNYDISSVIATIHKNKRDILSHAFRFRLILFSSYYAFCLISIYLQKAEAFVCAAVPLWCRSNSTKSSLPTDNSTSDAKTGQGYVYGSSLLAY
jgi:hypothetical protein